MTLVALLLAAALAAPDGNEWQDPSRLSLEKEPVSTLRAPADALDLSGVEAWSFNWARRPSERPAGFEKPEYDVSAWPKVTVPCSWQASGIRRSGERFGVPVYVNTPYTFTPPRLRRRTGRLLGLGVERRRGHARDQAASEGRCVHGDE